MSPPDLMTVVTAVTAASIYSAVFYAKRRTRDEQPFKPRKAAATLLVGAGVGLAFALAGDPVRQETIEVRLVTYSGVIALLESALKIVAREYEQHAG